MKAEQVKGSVKQAVGKAQDFLGELSGDQRLQMEGTARQAAGELQQRYGDLLEQCTSVIQRKPRITLLILAGLTLTAVWLARRHKA